MLVQNLISGVVVELVQRAMLEEVEWVVAWVKATIIQVVGRWWDLAILQINQNQLMDKNSWRWPDLDQLKLQPQRAPRILSSMSKEDQEVLHDAQVVLVELQLQGVGMMLQKQNKRRLDKKETIGKKVKKKE